MDKLINLISESPFGESPVMPELLEGTTIIQFQCRKGIDCWNACCSNIDISLTPVDILRLARRLGISTTEFLHQYTFPYEMEPNGITGVKFKPVEGGSACQFMRPEGCDVYTDRPTACRYYPVALLSMRRSDEYTDRQSYALVKEAHCHGHNEPRSLTIEGYRQQQGVVEYDDLGRGWRQLVLKKNPPDRWSARPRSAACNCGSWPATTSTASAISSPVPRSTRSMTSRGKKCRTSSAPTASSCCLPSASCGRPCSARKASS